MSMYTYAWYVQLSNLFRRCQPVICRGSETKACFVGASCLPWLVALAPPFDAAGVSPGEVTLVYCQPVPVPSLTSQ